MNWRPFTHTLTRSYMPAWAVLVVGVILTVAISVRLHRQSRATDQARFGRAIQQTAGAIHDRLQKYELTVLSLADFCATRDSITQAEWRFRIRMLANEQSYPGLLEAGFAELKPALSNAPLTTLAAAAAEAPSSSAGPFRLLHGWARPPSSMSGVDPNFLAEPDQANAAWQAILTSSATMSGIRQLSAEVNGGPAQGLTIFAPVSRGAADAPSTNTGNLAAAESRNNRAPSVRGVSFCAMEPNIMLDDLFGIAPRDVGFELFSHPVVSATNWLNPSSKQPRALDPGFRVYMRTNLPFQVLNQTWSICLYTTPLFEHESSLSRPWLVFPLGLGLTLAVTGLLVIQIHFRLRQDAVAADLKSACDDLQHVQNERERVSRELHDGAIQSLYLLQLTLGRCERLLRSNAAQAREVLARGRFAIDDLIAELRRFLLQDDSKQGKPVSLQEAQAVLQQLVQRFRNTQSVAIQMTGEASAPVFLAASQLGHLKQIAQEAMSNGLRHSRAKRICLEFSASAGLVRLDITDDGQGFDPRKSAEAGNGLANMQARAAHLGGTLGVQSSPGQGTRVTLCFPATSTIDLHHE